MLRPAAVAGLLAFGAAAPAQAVGVDDYIGSIGLAGFVGFCPSGTLPADGRLLPIAQYNALFALFGDSYGGDAKTTFALPDLRGLEPLPDPRTARDKAYSINGVHYCVTVVGTWPERP
jgi:hypothetical protein